MGKYLIQYAVPAILSAWVAIWVVRTWYIKRFGKTIDNLTEINRKSKEYESRLETK